MGEFVCAAEAEAEELFEATAVWVGVDVGGGGTVRVTVGEAEPVGSSDGVLSAVPLRVGSRVSEPRAEAVTPLAEALRVNQLAEALMVELCDTELHAEGEGPAEALREPLAHAESEREPEGDPELGGVRLAVRATVAEADWDGERLCVGDVVKVRLAVGDTVSEREPVLHADEEKLEEGRGLEVGLGLWEREMVGEPLDDAERHEVGEPEGDVDCKGLRDALCCPDMETVGAGDREPVRGAERQAEEDGVTVREPVPVDHPEDDRE